MSIYRTENLEFEIVHPTIYYELCYCIIYSNQYWYQSTNIIIEFYDLEFP